MNIYILKSWFATLFRVIEQTLAVGIWFLSSFFLVWHHNNSKQSPSEIVAELYKDLEWVIYQIDKKRKMTGVKKW